MIKISKKGDLISAVDSVARGAALSKAELVVYSPDFYETAAKAKEFSKEMNTIGAENNDAVISASIGSTISGKRCLSIVSDASMEIRNASQLRLPLVVCNISQNIDNLFSLRDTGMVLIFAENNQEIIDSIIQSYKICEDNKVILPSLINVNNLDIREAVHLPTQQTIDKFLRKLNPKHRLGKDNVYFGVYDDQQTKQREKAMLNALNLLEKTGDKWKQKFRRELPLVEEFMTKDAEHIIITMGLHSYNAKAVVKKQRSEGKKIGLLRFRVIRPLPNIKNLIEGKNVGVVESTAILGNGGVLYNEIKHMCKCSNFISSKNLSENDFENITKKIMTGNEGTYWL
ncbi:hypothetical protein ACFLQN_00095 [Candidatus Aenigmatarchaeota archaeon]